MKWGGMWPPLYECACVRDMCKSAPAGLFLSQAKVKGAANVIDDLEDDDDE